MPKKKRIFGKISTKDEKPRKKLKSDPDSRANYTIDYYKLINYELKRKIGDYVPQKKFNYKLFSSIKPAEKVSCCTNEGSYGSEAIYNIEFSKDNKILIAAGAKSEICVFDPLSYQKINSVDSKHTDGVNCLTFLDSRLFTTSSDDQTIAIWDIRNLSFRVSTLTGHTGWVKDVSYMPQSNRLISSAFDDTVRVWNINDFEKDGCVKSEQVLDIKCLTRTMLSQDCSKLVAATTSGHFFIIDNIDLEFLKSDANCELQKFLYESSNVPKMTKSRKRNRIEFIIDFPLNSNPWCITSVKTHPNSKSVISRYSSEVDHTEWTVVHDIEEKFENETNSNRLKYFISEPSAAPGYIKELSFNEDGSLICSPFGNSIRFLAFNKKCDSEPIDGNKPCCLEEINFVTFHNFPVLTARFAFGLPLVASGCLGGHVCFYQTRF
ncbi:DDB1- and CUL4-associated factor 10 homolog [Hydra vulgaris]|uniref:DDB1- and CUL4-associated factor 10 homolog n=1 Tax=Hydra vulgaris TaxID=6087 RepID=A0ABM4CH04_HYDVU